MIINRDRHNKFVANATYTDLINRVTSSDSSATSGSGTGNIIYAGGGGGGSLDPALIEELRNQEAFSYLSITDDHNVTLDTEAKVEKDHIYLGFIGDKETTETSVSRKRYLPKLYLEGTGTIPGKYYITYDEIKVIETVDGEPTYVTKYLLTIDKAFGDPIFPYTDFNAVSFLKEGTRLDNGISLNDNPYITGLIFNEVGGLEQIIWVTPDFTDFDEILLVNKVEQNVTPVVSIKNISIRYYITVQIGQAEASRLWKFDEEGRIYTDYDAYSTKTLGANGIIWTDEGFKVGNYVQGAEGGTFSITNKQEDADGNITYDTYIEADRLRVRKKAYFETLEIVNVNTVGGKQIISPGGAITVNKVEEYDTYYRCYFLGEQEDTTVENRFKVGDLAFSQNFNIKTPGIYQQASNSYYWRAVVGVSTDVNADGNHYIDLSKTDCDQGSNPPSVNDVIAQLGNKTDIDRLSALIFSSVDAESPRMMLCYSIDTYSLAGTTKFDVGVDHSNHYAYLNVTGTTFIGDDNSYISFNPESGLTVKGLITATGSSTLDGKLFSEIFATSEEVAQLFAEANEKITAVELTANGTSTKIGELNNYVDGAFKDKVLTSSEASRLSTLIETVNTTIEDAKKAYEEIIGNEYLVGSGSIKTNLETSYAGLYWEESPYGAALNFVSYIESLISKASGGSYTITDADIANVNTLYENFNNKYSAYVIALNAANRYIMDEIGATALSSAVAEYAYLNNLFDLKTTITGGLVATGILALGVTGLDGKFKVNAGFNGTPTEATDDIALWFGGDMLDKKNFELGHPQRASVASSLFRYDGSGYLGYKYNPDEANIGETVTLWWDVDGNLHADPLSFFIGEEEVGYLLTAFYVPDDNGDGQGDYIQLKIPFENRILIGSAYIAYEPTANTVAIYTEDSDGIRTICNLYATGDVTAYGNGDASAYPLLVNYMRDLKDVNYNKGEDPAAANAMLMWNGETWLYVNKNDVGLNEALLELYLTENEYAKKSDIITNIAWSAITGKPSTLAGYGITDAVIVKDGDSSSTIDPNANYPAVGFWMNVGSYFSMVNRGWGGQLKISNMELSIRGCNNSVFGDWTKVLTESNYTSTLDTRYVKKSGDTMTGTLTISNSNFGKQLIIYRDAGATPSIAYKNNTELLGYIGIGSSADGESYLNPIFIDKSENVYRVWHAGNDGAGSGLDADLLDGYHRNNLYATERDWFSAVGLTKTITIAGDSNTFYPVEITVSDFKGKATHISIWKDLNSTTPSIPGNHANGTSSLWLVYEMRRTNWDGNGGFVRTVYKSQQYATLVASARTNTQNGGNLIVWLRGGTCTYNITCTNSFTATPYYTTTNVSHASGYTDNVSPTTSIDNGGICGGIQWFGNVTGNAETATQLQTTRTIWGQSFNGTANVSGDIYGCTRVRNTDSQSIYLGNSDNSGWVYTQDIASHRGDNYWAIRQDGQANFAGNVRIGSSSSNYTLTVSGDIYAVRGWLRTSGSTGWYSESYDGGWYMTDSNFVRVYNHKNIYLDCNSGSWTYHRFYNGSVIWDIATKNGTGGTIADTPNAFEIRDEGNNTGIAIRHGTSNNGRLVVRDNSSESSICYWNSSGMRWTAGVGVGVYDAFGWWYNPASTYRAYLDSSGNFVATGEITAYSDIRLKNNITTLLYRGRLSPKSYIKDNKQSIGFIAQEVQELYPELVLETGGDNNYLALNYGNITAVLSALINIVEDEVTILKHRVQELENRLSRYEDVE